MKDMQCLNGQLDKCWNIVDNFQFVACMVKWRHLRIKSLFQEFISMICGVKVHLRNVENCLLITRKYHLSVG